MANYINDRYLVITLLIKKNMGVDPIIYYRSVANWASVLGEAHGYEAGNVNKAFVYSTDGYHL